MPHNITTRSYQHHERLKINKKGISTSCTTKSSRGINKNYLSYIKIETKSGVYVTPNLTLAAVNVRSIKKQRQKSNLKNLRQ